jgi:hypothetical protein
MKSKAQNRAMHAAASGKSNLGIPKKVGKEFVSAQHGKKVPPVEKVQKNQKSHSTPRRKK